MAPHLFKEYHWYNLNQADYPDILMDELVSIVLTGITPSTEDYNMGSEGDDEGPPVDWASIPFRGGFSRSNSPSIPRSPWKDRTDSEDEKTLDLMQWEGDPMLLATSTRVKIEDLADIITQRGTEERPPSPPPA